MNKPTRHKTMADYIAERSMEICTDNQCTEDDHNCESQAYFTASGQLLDICASDFFQGSSAPYANVSLPFYGTQRELEDLIAESIADNYEFEPDINDSDEEER